MDDQYHTSIRPTRAIPRLKAMQEEPPGRHARALRRPVPAGGHAGHAPRACAARPCRTALRQHITTHHAPRALQGYDLDAAGPPPPQPGSDPAADSRSPACRPDRPQPAQNIRMSPAAPIDLRPGVREPVVLLVSRREVEQADLGSVLSRLKPFLATREDARRYRGQMTPVVDGYDDDPRELVDIPEVRALLRRLEAQWPYWAYFFNQVDDSVKLLLSCAAGSRFLGRGAVEMDPAAVGHALAHGFGGMNEVFERFGFPEDELEQASRGLAELVEQAGMA